MLPHITVALQIHEWKTYADTGSILAIIRPNSQGQDEGHMLEVELAPNTSLSLYRYYGRTLSDASMLYFADVFLIYFFIPALVGQTVERIFTKLSHVVHIRCYLRTY